MDMSKQCTFMTNPRPPLRVKKSKACVLVRAFNAASRMAPHFPNKTQKRKRVRRVSGSSQDELRRANDDISPPIGATICRRWHRNARRHSAETTAPARALASRCSPRNATFAKAPHEHDSCSCILVARRQREFSWNRTRKLRASRARVASLDGHHVSGAASSFGEHC